MRYPEVLTPYPLAALLIQRYRDGAAIATDFVKTDEEQRLVTGWASIITNPDGTPYVDSQGDVILEKDLVDTVNDFMAHHRHLGDSHARITGIGTIVESLVVTNDVKKILGLPPTMPSGWLITAKVLDDDVWARVKSGELAGFSIGGRAVREPITKDLTSTDAHVPTPGWEPWVRRRRKRKPSAAP